MKKLMILGFAVATVALLSNAQVAFAGKPTDCSPRLPATPTSEDSGEKQEAVKVPTAPLATIWDEEPARALAVALEDDNFWVRDAAVEALEGLSGDEAARALATAVQNEETWIREAAVKALGKIGGDEAAYALAPALQDEDSWIH